MEPEEEYRYLVPFSQRQRMFALMNQMGVQPTEFYGTPQGYVFIVPVDMSAYMNRPAPKPKRQWPWAKLIGFALLLVVFWFGCRLLLEIAAFLFATFVNLGGIMLLDEQGIKPPAAATPAPSSPVDAFATGAGSAMGEALAMPVVVLLVLLVGLPAAWFLWRVAKKRMGR